MSELDVKLAGKSLADYTNTQLRLALGAVLYTNTADMWKRYLNQLGYSGDVSQMLQKYYVEYSVPQNFRNYINAGAFIYSPQQLFTDGSKGVVYDNNDFVDSATWRRNLLTYSEQFNNAYWTAQRTTITANATTAPDGTMTADKIVEDLTSGEHRIYSPQVGVGTSAMAWTIRAKAAERSWIALRSNTGTRVANFNVSTGVVGTTFGTGVSASISAIGNGWYLCTMIATPTDASERYTINIGDADTGTGIAGATYTGDGTSGLFIWGAQLERASSASDYQRITDFNSDFLAAFPSTTLFLDSAGTTAATVNGLVGLQLDKSLSDIVSRRNLLVSTNNPAGTGWTRSGVTASDAGIALPTGDNLYSIIPSAAATTAFLQQPVTAGIAQTISWYGRSDEYAGVRMRDGGGSLLCHFDFATGTVTDAGGATGSMTAVGGGTYYCTITYTPAQALFRIYVASLVADGVSTSPAGDGTGGVYLGSFQLEVGSTATDYQRVVTGNGDWMPGNHRYQTSTSFKPVLRGTPVGSSLVTNGDFATDTAWTKIGAATISGGTGNIDGTSALAMLSQSVGLANGKTYKVNLNVVTLTGTVLVWDNNGRTLATYTTTGAKEFYFTHDNAQPQILLRVAAGANIASIDNFTVHDVSAGQVTAPYGLQYDGVDDFMQTAAVDFTATDKMFVCAGVRKLSDAATAVIAELSASSDSNNGAFNLAIIGPSGNYYCQSSGTVRQNVSIFSAASPDLAVMTVTGDISGDMVVQRRNGVLAGSLSADQGAGNYGNYALYFGRRGGASLPYNGLDFGMVICGKTLTSTQISQTERYIAQRTGIAL